MARFTLRLVALLCALSVTAGCQMYFTKPGGINTAEFRRLDYQCERDADLRSKTDPSIIAPFSYRSVYQRCMESYGYTRTTKPTKPAKPETYQRKIAKACFWTLTKASWGRCALEHGATAASYCGEIQDIQVHQRCVDRFNAAVAAASPAADHQADK